MITSYSLEEVAAAHLPSDWKDPVRWLKSRLKARAIPGKEISRGVWRMTDAHIEQWLATTDEAEPAAPADSTVASIADGLSKRSSRRARSAS